MLTALIALAVAPPLRLEGDYLVDGKDRINLAHPSGRTLRLGPKHSLAYQETVLGGALTTMVTAGNVKLLDFSKQIEAWVNDDNLWGRKLANDLRYTSSRGENDRGIKADVTGAVPASGNSATCVLNFRSATSSYGPVILQLLVRLDPANPEKPKFLRILPGNRSANDMNTAATLRFVKWRGKNFLWLGDKFVAMNADGSVGKETMPGTKGTPRAQLSGRYLLTFRVDSFPVYEAYDLLTRKTHVVAKGSASQSVWAEPSFDSTWLLVEETIGGKGKPVLIHITDGRRAPAPAETRLVWKNYAIAFNRVGVKVYSIPSGKPAASLTWADD